MIILGGGDSTHDSSQYYLIFSDSSSKSVDTGALHGRGIISLDQINDHSGSDFDYV